MFMFQESEKGSWHVPLAPGTANETSWSWLCITQASADDAVATVSNGVDTSGDSQRFANDFHSLDSKVNENNTTSLTGKRKERSPP